MAEITLQADISKLEALTDFVNEQLEAADFPLKTIMKIDIAIDELFSNIAYYAYKPGSGDATVRVEIGDGPKKAVVTFIDSGKQYNPLENKDPDISLSVEERSIGGLGIFMVKKSMDDVTYKYENGLNMLTIVKNAV